MVASLLRLHCSLIGRNFNSVALLSKVLVLIVFILSCNLFNVFMYSFGLSFMSVGPSGGFGMTDIETFLGFDALLFLLPGDAFFFSSPGCSNCFAAFWPLPIALISSNRSSSVAQSSRALVSISKNVVGSPSILRVMISPFFSHSGFFGEVFPKQESVKNPSSSYSSLLRLRETNSFLLGLVDSRRDFTTTICFFLIAVNYHKSKKAVRRFY
mmetsp:Transcript_7589/g.7682  ORF Transcript_7589/g.7682 Transcript_7589/m.7682 type:complete len:212 (+) Transcript_7589:121-756(+)